MRLPGRCAPPELVSGHSRDPRLDCSPPASRGVGRKGIDHPAARPAPRPRVGPLCCPGAMRRSELSGTACPADFGWASWPSLKQEHLSFGPGKAGRRSRRAAVVLQTRAWSPHDVKGSQCLSIPAPTAARSRAARPTRGHCRPGFFEYRPVLSSSTGPIPDREVMNPLQGMSIITKLDSRC